MAGEKKGDRKVMDGLVRDAVKAGVAPSKAQKMARDAMVKADRQAREQGKR